MRELGRCSLLRQSHPEEVGGLAAGESPVVAALDEDHRRRGGMPHQYADFSAYREGLSPKFHGKSATGC